MCWYFHFFINFLLNMNVPLLVSGKNWHDHIAGFFFLPLPLEVYGKDYFSHRALCLISQWMKRICQDFNLSNDLTTRKPNTTQKFTKFIKLLFLEIINTQAIFNYQSLICFLNPKSTIMKEKHRKMYFSTF